MSNKTISRRAFLQRTMVGATGLAMIPTLGSLTSCGKSANDMINVGFIGLGRQALSILKGFNSIPGVKVIAASDVYEIKRKRFEIIMKEHYAAQETTCEVKTYEDYNELINRSDIDAVVIATPDHWHAMIAIAAANAGKDIYLEKPITFTIYEGQQLVKAVRKNKRILQVGSQQRSSSEFQHAVKMIQENRLGELDYILTHIGDPPSPYNLPRQEVPAGLNWDKWLGPLSTDFYFNNDLNPPISLDPRKDEKIWGAWRWYKGMGGGFTTDWGAHMFDIIQWAMGKDGSGPVAVSPKGIDGADAMTFTYDNGVKVMTKPFAEEWNKGVKFFGKNGSWLRVERGLLEASDDSLLPPTEDKVKAEGYETAPAHYITFIESIKSRKDPNVPIEIGHSSCVMCTIGNIADDMQQSLKWNPAKEIFEGNDDANKHLHYQYREGYKL